MSIPYLGPGWGRKALEVMKSDPRVAEAVKGVDLRLLIRIRETPPGRYHYLYAHFDGTGLADGRMGHDGDDILATLPEPTFTIEGPYDVFASVQRGELTERKAILSGRLHIKGSRLLALRYMGALETVTEVLGEIPCQT
ncbi:MAG: SCP2 sterol-binding domain-containing protein [Candidatus Thermoplasmatota archaeon]